MQITCPTCRAAIATGDINVSTDVALCRSCGNTFHISEARRNQQHPGISDVFNRSAHRPGRSQFAAVRCLVQA